MNDRPWFASKVKLARAIACVWISLAFVPFRAFSDPPAIDDVRSAMVRTFTEARDAFARKDWNAASQSFRSVSQQCAGSPLALEANYFALMADWQRKDEKCHETMQAWLREAKSMQDRLVQSQRPAPQSMDGWISNVQLMLAQSEKKNQQLDQAERRLKSLLRLDDVEREIESAWPSTTASFAAAWLELGLLAQESRKDLGQAELCFRRAVESSQEASELQLQSLAALAKTQLQLSEHEGCQESIARLEQMASSDSWRTKAALLKSDLARARQDAAAFAEALRPVVELALAGRTDLQLAYELAVALLEAREDEDSEAILVHIIHREPENPIAVEARIRLARQRMKRQEWNDAQQLLDQAIGLGCTDHWVPHARLARAQVHLALGIPASARDDLTLALQVVSDDIELETTIRFELAESLRQLQEWDEASVHWNLLSSRFEDASSENPLPAWLARVWLHQAELQALRQNWSEAEAIVSKIQFQFPECDCRGDVDYMRARCLISKAQFDDARNLLEQIATHTAVSSPDLKARAWWMMGETFLMQRRYREALQPYARVLEMESSPYWKSASWMQIGQCSELLRDPETARQAYQSIVDQDADGPFRETAQQRLKLLPASNATESPNVRTSQDRPGYQQK
jgi:tetratricopeptide (TPR) repeat protein